MANKKLIIITVLVALLFVSGFAIYLYSNQQTENKETKKTEQSTTTTPNKKGTVQTNVPANPAYKDSIQNKPPVGMPEYTPPPGS